MKLRLRPMCRPGTLQHHRVPHRTLTRRNRRTAHDTCIPRSLNASTDISAVKQSGLGVSGPQAAQRQEQAELVLLRNLEPGLAQLPVKHRDVLVLVWLEEMSYEQAAEVLGLSVGTVRSRLNRALEQLHRWLASADDSATPGVN